MSLIEPVTVFYSALVGGFALGLILISGRRS